MGAGLAAGPTLALAGLALAAASAAAQPAVTAEVFPAAPLLERDAHGQYLSWDFLLANNTAGPLRLVEVELSAYDGDGALLLRRYVGGVAGRAILTIPERTVAPGDTLGLLNPFHVLEPGLDLARLVYRFRLEDGAGARHDARSVVEPTSYGPRARLRLPLEDRFIVYDGYDFYSHHRRQDPGVMRGMGLRDNPVRHALDLTPVGPDGAAFRGDPAVPGDWWALGRPVVAPAAGRVAAAAGDVPDNRVVDGELVYPEGLTDRQRLLGNHVVIDHGAGEFSVLAHLQEASVPVAPGDRVAAGQRIGRIGFSGDTGLHVHLHYGLVDAPEPFAARSLPPAFVDFVRVRGAERERVARGRIDTGEILEPARAATRP